MVFPNRKPLPGFWLLFTVAFAQLGVYLDKLRFVLYKHVCGAFEPPMQWDTMPQRIKYL